MIPAAFDAGAETAALLDTLTERAEAQRPTTDLTAIRYLDRPATQAAVYTPRHAKQPRAGRHRRAEPPAVTVVGDKAAMVAFALAQVGEPYVWGAAGPDRWDCSGLALRAAAQIGVTLPHRARDIARRGTPITRAQLQPGDLVFWGQPAYHVAISLGGNRIVHAANPRTGVVIGTIYGTPSAYRRI